MGLEPENTARKTLPDNDEMEGLLIQGLVMQEELDEFEQQGIEKAILWSMKRSFKQKEILTETFIQDLHKRMFGVIWSWAGTYRKTNKNKGVDYWRIKTEVWYLLNDVNDWIKNETYKPDEIAIRLKYRLASIYCFLGGNGRHSRLLADIVVEKVFRRPVFSWGATLVGKGESRSAYLKAMKAADLGNYMLLIAFARS